MYAPFAPVLHYNTLQGDFVGGNFWDMRASGYRLQNPSAEQAQGPPTNPVEMGLPDSACLAYRLSQAPYRKLFEAVWGKDSFTIQWPSNIEKICSTPRPPPDNDQYPVHLSVGDRARSDHVYDGFALAVSAYEFYEGSPDQHGYSANPEGHSYIDSCVGHFLRRLKSLSGQLDPDASWMPLASKFDGKFQVPTLRNVDMRPSADFVKAYMHNGYFESLKEVVHFYNTRTFCPDARPMIPAKKPPAGRRPKTQPTSTNANSAT